MQILDASPTVEDCTFTANFGNRSAGAMLIKGASPAGIRRCTFTGNTASPTFAQGGAIAIEGASPSLVACTFSSNSSYEGGALDIRGTSHLAVINTFFIANSAVEGGAIHTEFGDAGGTLVNCVFSSNSAVSHGGAIDAGANSPAVLELINCTLAGNWVSAPGPLDGDGVVGILDLLACWPPGERVLIHLRPALPTSTATVVSASSTC